MKVYNRSLAQPERSEKVSHSGAKSLEREVKVMQVCVPVGVVPRRRNSMCKEPEMRGKPGNLKN